MGGASNMAKRPTSVPTAGGPDTDTSKVTKPAAKAKLRVGANPKALATKRGEPYVAVLGVDIDPDNVQNGAFELDWNDIFVAKLVRAGYKGRDDAQIVDQWFQDICRNVVLENYEQWAANPGNEVRTVSRRDIGDGRSEVS